MHIYMYMLPVLLPQLMDQFGLSLTQIGFLWTMCYFLYGVMALPAGFLADKWSYKAVLMMFFIGTPIALCIIGSAQSTLNLGIGLALLGILASLYHPAGLAMISHTVRKRGKALGLQGMAGNLGLAFASVIAGDLAIRFSWRYAYYILSLPSFATGIVFLPVLRAAERWKRISINTENHAHNTAESVQNISNPPRRRLTVWAVIVLYIAMAVVGFCYQGMTTMLPTYLDSKLLLSIGLGFQRDLEGGVISENLQQKFNNNGLSLPRDAPVSTKKEGSRWTINDRNIKYTVMKEANKLKVYISTGRGKWFVMMILLVGMLGQYMGGHLSDRYRKTRLYLLFNAISLPFMIIVGLASGILVIFVAGLFTLFHFAGQPIENGLIAQYTPSRLRSSSYGLKFVFAFGIGSFAAAFSGYVGEHFGLNSIFLALGGVIILAVIVITLLNMTAKEKRIEASQ